MRCNPHAHPRCARRRRCLLWRVDRKARWVVGPIAVALRLRTGGPWRARCGGRLARGTGPGGVRARECARPSRRSEAPRPANRPPTLSPLARYRRHISHGRRQAKARRQEARRQEVRSRVERDATEPHRSTHRSPAKKPAAKKPAPKKCGAASNATRPSLTGRHTGRPRRSRPRRSPPRSRPRSPRGPASTSICLRAINRSLQAAKKSPAKPAAKPAAKKCGAASNMQRDAPASPVPAQVAREEARREEEPGQKEEPRQETGLEGEESCEEEDGRQEVPGEAIHAQQEEVVVPCLSPSTLPLRRIP